MKATTPMTRLCAGVLALVMVFCMLPVSAFAATADATLTASLAEAKSYIDGITINNSSNDPATVVKNFKTHFTWDNEKRENSKSYLFDWSYYNGVVFEGIEYVYEVTGETVYADYVIEYMSSLINANGGWATCSNNASKQCAGYNATHGADCYKTASLLLDSYQMTGDSRYLTMAATLYADLDSAANSYSLKNAGNNFRHTWATDPTPDLWLDGLYMILPFRAEYAKYIGDTEELDLIVDRMQWVSDNMYNSSKGLFYHAADSASSNSGTYWLRSIGWYAAAIVDIMDSMEGENLEAMKAQLVKLVDGMRACQNSSNGMWLNNMNASQSSSNPYETSGTALTCYAVMKAVNRGWLDESYADMAILAFNGICNEKLSGSTLTDICFKGAPGSSNSTFYDNEGKGVGPFIMFYAEVLRYVNTEDEAPEETVPEETEPEATEPEETVPAETQPEEPEMPVYQGTGNLVGDTVYTLDSDGINSGEKYLIVYSKKALQNNSGVDANPAVTISSNTITLADDSKLAWTITQSGSNYYVENNGSYVNLTASGNDPIGSAATVYITRSGSTYKFRNTSSSGAYLRYSNSQLFCAGTSSSNNGMSLYRRTGAGLGDAVTFTVTPSATTVNPGESLNLNGSVSAAGKSVALSSCAITWASSNNAVATVSGGTVTGVSGGNATITATLTAAGGTDLVNDIVLTIPVTVQAHVYEALVTAPTCTEGGYTTYTCDCGDSYVADHTDALGHDHTSVVTAPTCTAQGFTTHTCTRCGDSYVDSYTDALGHTYASVTVEATCTADGSVTYTCDCGDSYVEVIPAAGHSYASVVTAPTCTAQGYTTHTCAGCGDSYVDSYTDALGHTYTSVTVEATCTADGSVTYTCDCGDSYVEVIPAAGHDYTSIVTAPTCTEAGYTTHTCGNCGDSYITDETAALGHHYKTATMDATCTTNGAIVHACTRCDDSWSEVIPATGHNHTAVVTAPTCTADGYTTYTCACGDSYVDDEVAALGHDYETVTVEATCTADGSVTYTCHCGETYTEVIPATGHEYAAVVTAPTCETAGYTTYTCHCGDSYVADEVAALGHDYETVTVNATCTADGSVTYTCHCGETYTEVIPATGHEYAAVVTAPTCETAGYTTYTCHCGDTYVADQVAALGHDYDTVTVEPTCESAGYTTRTCQRCGDSHVTDETAALGHAYVSVIVEETCETAGHTTHTCDRCGDSYISDEVAALGHDLVSVVTVPTCETAGYTTHTCARCGEVTVDAHVAALGHDWHTVTVDATCVSNGSVTASCAACGEETVEVIPALGHAYDAVVTAPTCTEGGYTTYICGNCGDTYISDETAALGHTYEDVTVEATCETDGSVTHTCHCGDSYVEVIPATGHDYVSVVTAPTCTENGYTTHTCAGCGDSYITDETAALGHTYEVVTVEATCDTDGSVTHTCHCGDSYTDVIPAFGHDYASVVTAPTCETAGYTTHTCATCGDSYISDEIAALGHDYEVITVEATCTTDGSVTHTCTVCGNSYIDVIPAYGHDYVSVVTAPTCETAGYTTHTCTTCGDSYITDEVAALGHDYEVITVEATCTTDGSVTYTCYCGDSYVESIPATGHDYVSVVTAPTCTENGYTTHTCGNCGDSFISDETAALGHTYESVTVEATCDTDGSVTYTCHCGDSYMEVIPAFGHDYASVVTAPTCENAGYTTNTCGNCGDSFISDETAALGHTHEVITVNATCTENGSVTYTCHCGDSYSEVLPATGHSYTCTESNGSLVYTCAGCGDSYEEIINWIALPGTYVLDTDGVDIGAEHKYLIVGSNRNYALTLNGTTVGSAAVTITNNTITLDDASAYEFYFVSNSKESGSYLLTQDGTKSIYHMVGNLYYGTDNKGYWHFGSSSNGAYQLYDTDWGTWYLNYGYVWGSNTVNRFAVSSSARTVRLFKAVDSYVRLAGSMNQTYTESCGTAAVTEADVLAKLSIQLSSDGATVSGTKTVTSDMLTWNKALDGNTAGVYTANVTYQGEILGTVTVTVTAKHVYETVTVAPTCESTGHTTATCVNCGHSIVSDETAALGHSYTCVETDDTLIYTCTVCGDSYEEAIRWTALEGVYVLDTDGVDIGAEHKYIVVGSNKNYALTRSGSTVTTTAVTITDNAIVLDNSACEFYFTDNSSRESGSYLLTQDGSKSVYHVGGAINYGHDSKGYWHIGNAGNGAYQLYDYDNAAWYLNYGYVWANDSVSRFAVSSNSRTVRLFQAADGYARLSGERNQTAASTTEAAVLEKLTIQRSMDGATVSETVAVKPHMLTWDSAFNGKTPGTYTATITYLGQNLGTVTVTITG